MMKHLLLFIISFFYGFSVEALLVKTSAPVLIAQTSESEEDLEDEEDFDDEEGEDFDDEASEEGEDFDDEEGEDDFDDEDLDDEEGEDDLDDLDDKDFDEALDQADESQDAAEDESQDAAEDESQDAASSNNAPSSSDTTDDESLEKEFESSLGGDDEEVENQTEEFLKEEQEASEQQDDQIEDEFDNINEQEASSVEVDESSDSLNTVSNIRYVAEKDQIVIDTRQTVSYQTRKNVKNNQLIIEILQARLEDNLKWPFILKDFKTSFGMVQADQKTEDGVRVIIQLKEGASQPNVSISESGLQILIAYEDPFEKGKNFSKAGLKNQLPAKTLEEFYFSEKEYSGSPISFHVISAPVQQVLKFISEESGLNMVISDKIQGRVSLKLEDVPWDQALDTIFKVQNLGYTRDGNVIIVAPLEEIEKRDKKLRDIAKTRGPFIPFKTEVVPVAYGKLSEIKTKVQSFLTGANSSTSAQGVPGGDERKGEIIIHEETNAFIIVDTQDRIDKIKKLVRYLDEPPRQVMIEAQIVEAEETFVRNMGLNWQINNSLPVNISAGGFLDFFKGNYSGDLRFQKTSDSGGFSLNLSQIPFIGDIGTTLNLAEKEGFVRVVSSPKIVAISGKKASIKRNSPILRPTTTTVTAEGNSQQQTESVDVVISLDVEPVITSQESVFLKVNIKRDNPSASGGSDLTAREANTEVLIKDGHTVVIGGIYQHDESSDEGGIPFLSKVPLVKWLFGSIASSKSKNELLIFLTPKIMKTPRD